MTADPAKAEDMEKLVPTDRGEDERCFRLAHHDIQCQVVWEDETFERMEIQRVIEVRKVLR